MATPMSRCRQLVVDVAKKLNKSDCEELVFLYQLPEKYSQMTALHVLVGLIESGIVSLAQPETLKEVVQSVKRNDLTKEIDKHIKDWAKQDKKRSPAVGDGTTVSTKLLSPKDASLKARFDHVILQTEWLVKHIEELRGVLSADGDEVYHRAERILCEIQETTDELTSKLKKARSAAKLGDTAFKELLCLKSACDDLIQEVSRTVCHSDPLSRKSCKSCKPGKQS